MCKKLGGDRVRTSLGSNADMQQNTSVEILFGAISIAA